ncbi:transposase [Streptomyces sp. M10(2022)]
MALRAAFESRGQFTNGHRRRRCRYCGLAKTHVQHVLTTLAINVDG